MKAFLLCLLIGGSGVGYVWQKEQIIRLGQQIKSRETCLARIQEQNEKLRKQLATMRSPHTLELRIRELNLGLVSPQQSQICVLREPAGEPLRPELDSQYALQDHRAPPMP